MPPASDVAKKIEMLVTVPATQGTAVYSHILWGSLLSSLYFADGSAPRLI